MGAHNADVAHWAAALDYALRMGGDGKYAARRLRLARKLADRAGLDPNAQTYGTVRTSTMPVAAPNPSKRV